MKRINAILLIIAMMVGIASFATAQTSKSKWNLTEKIPLNPKVKTGKLSNGLTYYIMNNEKPKNRAELYIVVRAGAVQEDDDQAGLAHFTEHMCFNGTKNFPKGELVSFLETTGMRFGADVNASTGFDRTMYTLTIPLDSAGLLDKGMLVLEDWLSNVSFDEEEINKERGVILEEWRLRSNAQSRIFEKHFGSVAYGTKFPKRMPIGDTAIIMHAPKSAFTRYYQEWYRPNISAIIVVGDIDVNQIENMIKTNYADVKNPTNARPLTFESVPVHKDIKVSIASDKELPMPTFVLYWKHNKAKDEYTYGQYRRSIMERMISQMISLRMQELTREANPPFLQAGGGYSAFIADAEVFNLFVIPKLDNMLGSYEAGLTEVFRASKHGFTKGELERAKTETLRFYEKALQEKDKTESASFARELSGYFHDGESMPGIDLEFEMAKTFLDELTLAEVNKAMKSYIRDEGIVITVSLPEKPEIKAPTEKEILDIYNKVKNSDIAAYKDDEVTKPLMANKPNPGTIVSEKKDDKLGTIEMKLSNGAKVIAKPTDFKNDQVVMRAFSWGGSSLVSDADYYSAQAAAQIIDEGGISEFSATQLEKLLTGKMIGISPSIAEITEGFNGSYSPQDAETFYQLLYLYFTNPRKDADAFKSFISRTKEQIKNSNASPDKIFRDSVQVTLANHHYRSRPWTEETLNSINLDKAFEIYKQRFANAGEFTFFFVGNVDLASFREFVKTYIASLPSKVENEKWKDIGKRYPTSAVKKIVKNGIEPKSSVRLAIPGKFEWNRKNRFDFNSMIEVFSIRLREVIREDKGGVYGIGASGQAAPFPTDEYIISIGFGTAPDRVEELITAAKGIINELKSKPIDETYVVKVKEILKREYETGVKENNWWMRQLYNSEYYGTDKNEILDFNSMVDKLTAADIHNAAKKYLLDNKMIEMILYPED